MLKPELYDLMFKRKSIRSFDATPLDAATLSEIAAFAESAVSLYDIKSAFKIYDASQVKGMVGKAPHFLSIYSEEKNGCLENAGYIMEQIDLFLSSRGIGSCWQGMAKPPKFTEENETLKYIVTLAFGKPSAPLHRENLDEFKRKPLNEISSCPDESELLETVRLAPSAVNSQTWFYAGKKGEIHVYCKPNMLFKNMSFVDMGIALCFMTLAAQKEGRHIDIIHQDPNLPEYIKYKYIATAKIKSKTTQLS
ncbi:MAG: nitroreductase family protein [Bacillota bacterium]|nr:nitroreductase family protein [Bacillota bacterium]